MALWGDESYCSTSLKGPIIPTWSSLNKTKNEDKRKSFHALISAKDLNIPPDQDDMIECSNVDPEAGQTN